MNVSGFKVEFYGDPLAGIEPKSWDITGEFNFDSKEELEAFRKKIEEAFEYCSDTPLTAFTFEEIEERIKFLEMDNPF